MSRLGLFAPLLVLILLSGCEDADRQVLAPEDAAPLLLAPAGEPIVTTGFATPESMLHDTVDDVYLVTNVNGHPQILSNDGFISRLSPDGTIEELEWIQGDEDFPLHAPKGLTLVDDVLYVADVDGVRLYDRASGEPLGAWPVEVTTEPVPGREDVEWARGILLNDTCAGPRGEIYVTGTGADADLEGEIAPTGEDVIHTFRDGEPSTVAEGPELAGPNGCRVAGSNLYVVTLFSNELYRLNPSGRQFHVATLPQAGLDGIVRVGGSFLVSAVLGGEIYRLSLGGSNVTTLLTELESPADLGFDHERGRLLVPSLFGDRTSIHPME